MLIDVVSSQNKKTHVAAPTSFLRERGSCVGLTLELRCSDVGDFIENKDA
jgi:hypothetical protein